MYAEERRQALVAQAHSDGRVSVAEAALQFDVTPETIRRDLETLDREGALRRVHGGAIPSEFSLLGDLNLLDREGAASSQKDRIAAAATRWLPTQPGATVLMDAGTSTARLAALVPPASRFTCFTHSLPVAASLSTRTRVDVQLLGGRVRGVTQACVGPMALSMLRRLRVDVAFMGTNGVSLMHGLSTPDPDEAAIKEAMVKAAHTVVVLADSRKIGAETTTSFASLDAVSVLVTDHGITPTQHRRLTERGIEVVIA